MPRIEPLSPPYSPEQERRIAAPTTRPGTRPPPLAIFRTFARHPALQDAINSLGRFYLVPEPGTSTALSPRDREIVIARVCARCGCEYEWGAHVASFARAVGFSPEQVASTAQGGAADPVWPERDRLLLRLVDELYDGATVSDELWQALAAAWTEAQLIELLILAGWYHAICYFANGVRLEREPWAPRFPHG
jgi:4-carboxymuconolactone decarboxylase